MSAREEKQRRGVSKPTRHVHKSTDFSLRSPIPLVKLKAIFSIHEPTYKFPCSKRPTPRLVIVRVNVIFAPFPASRQRLVVRRRRQRLRVIVFQKFGRIVPGGAAPARRIFSPPGGDRGMIRGRCGQLLSHRELVLGGTAREARKGIAGAGRYRCHDDDIGSYYLRLWGSFCRVVSCGWINEIWTGQQVASRFFLTRADC